MSQTDSQAKETPKLLLLMHKEYSGQDLCYCPFCGNIDNDIFQIEDYVSHPMLWCDNCNARAVVDPNYVTQRELTDSDMGLPAKVIKKTFSDNDMKIIHKLEEKFKELGEDDREEFEIAELPIVFISKISDYTLSGFRSPILLEQEKIKEFLDSDCNIAIAKKYGIYLAIYPDFGFADEEWKNQTIKVNHDNMDIKDVDNIGVECNSYNVNSPKDKYHRNIDISCNWIPVSLLCIDSNGDKFIATYEGNN